MFDTSLYYKYIYTKYVTFIYIKYKDIIYIKYNFINYKYILEKRGIPRTCNSV